MEDTRRKLLENFDAEVHDRLKVNMSQSKEYLDRYTRMLWTVTKHELGKHAKFDDAYFTFMLKSAPSGAAAPPGSYYMSRHGIDGHRYRLGHPLAQHILSAAASRRLKGAEIVFDYTAWPQTAVAIEPLVGKAGTLVAHKVSVRGADDQDHIILAAMTDDGARLEANAAMRLFELPARKNGAAVLRLPEALRQTVEKQRKAILDDDLSGNRTTFPADNCSLNAYAYPFQKYTPRVFACGARCIVEPGLYHNEETRRQSF